MTAKKKKLDKSLPSIALDTCYEVWRKDSRDQWHPNSGHESLAEAQEMCFRMKTSGTVVGVVADTAVVKAERTRIE